MTFRFVEDYFYTFLLIYFFSANIFWIKRFCFAKILSQPSSKPQRNYEAEEHKDAPKADKEHDDEKYEPKKLVKWPKSG